MTVRSFVIWNGPVGEPYIHRFYTKTEAETELRALLKPYPSDHVWRQRLSVECCDALPGKGKKPPRHHAAGATPETPLTVEEREARVKFSRLVSEGVRRSNLRKRSS